MFKIFILKKVWYHKHMQDIFKTFEFDKIQDALLNLAKTDLARQKILNLSFLDKNQLKIEKDKLNEMHFLISRYSSLPINPSKTAIDIINMGKRSGILSCKDFYDISLDIETSFALNQYFKKVDISLPLLRGMYDKMFDLTNLYSQIKRIVSPSLTVKDDASELLYSLRNKIKSKEKKLQELSLHLTSMYKDYLNDDRSTIRDGHIVLPVKVTYKNKIGGIIYDISDSGSTVFIEPIEIVELNNEITTLKLEENEEVRRILFNLTNLVIIQEKEIINNNEIIGELDFLTSKALYQIEIDGVVASFDEEKRSIYLSKARHPLIDKNKVVANDYQLDEKRRILVISGPNAGGKTVSLKTVGLLVMLNQMGLCVSATEAKMSYFEHIYIDIGDNQSLSDNLSTFSAHISNIAYILKNVKNNDLVLIDELGTGTDPLEGEAIALSVIKYLRQKGCFGLVSSHFNKLKEYAFISDGVENSMMIFDEEKLLPTYIFKQSTPGKSYAFDVSSRYGLPQFIIDDATKELEKNNKNKDNNLLFVLQEKMDETTRLENKLKQMEKDLIDKENKLNNLKSSLEKRKENLLEEVKDEKEKMIEDTKQKIDKIIKELSSNKENKMHEYIDAKARLEELKEDVEEEIFNDDIKINDYVYIPSLNVYGLVKRIKGEKAYLDTDSGMGMNVSLSHLKKIDKPKIQSMPKKQKEVYIDEPIPMELNLIGERVDDALQKLDKYIDQARLRHMNGVRIIHGFGSGALRRAVREYLKTQKDVEFRSGNEYEGGGGATLVTFK